MLRLMGSLLYCFRFFLFGLLVIASLFLLVLLLSVSRNNASSLVYGGVTGSSLLPGSMRDSPNAVSRLVATVADWGNGVTTTTSYSVGGSLHAVGTAFSNIDTLGTHGSRAVVEALDTSAGAVKRGFLAIAQVPGNMLGALRKMRVSAIIQPSETASVPTIQPVAAVALTSAKVVVPAIPAAPTPPVSAHWPIHGMVTTLFGVPEPPYQPIHTGIDISDGRRAGVTPVYPFRPGRVIEAQHSGGLGNHVVLDHGGGETSVYGHMASIAVRVGQPVDETTTLGYEGSTGVSTGPHLHFEIRLNGTPVNPSHYITGQP